MKCNEDLLSPFSAGKWLNPELYLQHKDEHTVQELII